MADQNWCDGVCSTTLCPGCLGSYYLTEERWNDAAASGDYCSYLSWSSIGRSPVRRAMDGWTDPNVEPTIEDMKATLLPDDLSSLHFCEKNSMVFLQKFTGTSHKVSGESYTVYENTTYDGVTYNCGDVITINPPRFTWRWSYEYSSTYILTESLLRCPAWECPPNTHKDNGACVPDEGWEWCDDSHTSACPHCYTLGCLEATDLSLYPQCYDVGTTFELCVQWKPYDPNCQPTSEMDYFDVPITYEGSLANNISGPDTVRIDIQDNSTGCITLTVDSSIAFGGTLSIIPTSVPLCDPNESSIVLEICTANGGGDPSHSPGYGPGTYMPNIEDCTADKEYQDCCAYMPKDYLMWRNGIGVATAVPPYMKYFFINN